MTSKLNQPHINPSLKQSFYKYVMPSPAKSSFVKAS